MIRRYKAGEPAYNVTVISDARHNAFPALAYCADRSLFLGYRKASSHTGVDGTLVAKRSPDNGDTWSAESTIATLPMRHWTTPSHMSSNWPMIRCLLLSATTSATNFTTRLQLMVGPHGPR